MWKKSLLRTVCLLLWLLLFLGLPSRGFCSQTTEQAVTISVQDFNRLITNLAESETALTEAKQQLNDSNEALMIAQEQLSLSGMESTELMSQLIESRMQVKKLQEQLAQQSRETMLLKQQLNEASTDLEKANQFLQNTKQEVEKTIKEHEAVERRLRRQVTGWQIATVIGIVIGVLS